MKVWLTCLFGVMCPPRLDFHVAYLDANSSIRIYKKCILSESCLFYLSNLVHVINLIMLCNWYTHHIFFQKKRTYAIILLCLILTSKVSYFWFLCFVIFGVIYLFPSLLTFPVLFPTWKMLCLREFSFTLMFRCCVYKDLSAYVNSFSYYFLSYHFISLSNSAKSVICLSFSSSTILEYIWIPFPVLAFSWWDTSAQTMPFLVILSDE